MNFHVVFFAAGTLAIVMTLISLRREHISAEYSLSWLAAGTVIALLAAFPRFLEAVAAYLDIEPSGCFFIVGGLLIAAVLFQMSHLVSRLRDQNVLLTQRLAILEFQLQRFVEDHGFEEK